MGTEATSRVCSGPLENVDIPVQHTITTMAFIHPIQALATIGNDSIIFTVVKNVIMTFQQQSSGEYKQIGEWADTYDRSDSIKEKVSKEQERQIQENIKKQKDNEGNSVPKKVSEAKVPVPGPGAPRIYSCIRNLIVTKNGDKLISCADSDKSVLIFKIDLSNKTNCLELLKRQPFPKRPNAITISDDESTVIMADKFGDVYSIPVEGEPITNINEELDPILGHVSMLTDVLFKTDSKGKRFLITTDRDEHIKVSHFPQSFIVDKWLFGHKEFVSSVCSPAWKPNFLFSAGGDDSVYLWDWEAGKKLTEFNYSEAVKPYLGDNHLAPSRFQNENNDVIEYAVSKIVAFSTAPYVAFFVEATKVLFILKVDSEKETFTLSKTIDLPYNVISLESVQGDELVVSLDNRDSGNNDFVKFIKYDAANDDFTVDDAKSKAVDTCLKQFSNSEKLVVESADVYPLYSITTLKKHGEHYS